MRLLELNANELFSCFFFFLFVYTPNVLLCTLTQAVFYTCIRIHNRCFYCVCVVHSVKLRRVCFKVAAVEKKKKKTLRNLCRIESKKFKRAVLFAHRWRIHRRSDNAIFCLLSTKVFFYLVFV